VRVTDHEVFDHVSGRLSDLDAEVVRHVPPGGNWRDLPEDFPSARVRQIRASAKRGEGSRSTYYGRLAWNRPSYTISTYLTRPGNGCFIHPERARLLTVREAARLQSFPDSVRFHGTLRQRAMQVGNAVPPLLAYHLGAIGVPGTAVDLFSGAGGLGLGLSWAGHELVASVDNDEQACRTQERALPGHPVLRMDLSDDDAWSAVIGHIRRALGGWELGLLSGGPPCQGFSTAGSCRVDDPRNRLVLAFLRAVERLEPDRVLFENVPALRWRGQAFLDELVSRLDRLGYQVGTRILHSEAYGVPQLRRRLVVQARRGVAPAWPMPTHALSDPCFRDEQPGPHAGLPRPRTVGDAIADLSAAAGESPDSPVAATLAGTTYARWARGEVSLDALLAATQAQANGGTARRQVLPEPSGRRNRRGTVTG
jgi:DNA (cytosine-5)-methyltransferase 1